MVFTQNTLASFAVFEKKDPHLMQAKVGTGKSASAESVQGLHDLQYLFTVNGVWILYQQTQILGYIRLKYAFEHAQQS